MGATVSSRTAILEGQQSWARATARPADPRGYLATVDENLWRPMSDRTRADFTNGSGSELTQKMRALHSSSALAVNFFEFWRAADCTPLVRLLGLDSPVEAISFERQYPTGLAGNPPNLDVCISLASGRTVAIESKFCEWLGKNAPDQEYFKPKYFPEGSAIWTLRGLPECQRLAEDIDAQRKHFIHLDAAQLLKHALGLATQLGARFDLYYVYFEWPGSESALHRSEIDCFSKRVGSEIRFRSMTYQDLFGRLGVDDAEPDYFNYLRGRYFSPAERA